MVKAARYIPIENTGFELKVQNVYPFNVEEAEKKFDAKFLGIFPVNADYNFPCLIFYSKEPHPRGSNYFALYRKPWDGTGVFVTNAIAVEGRVHRGFISEDKKNVIYSAYRHDYVEDYNDIIDGGIDYVRTSIAPESGRLVDFVIKDGKIFLTSDPDSGKIDT